MKSLSSRDSGMELTGYWALCGGFRNALPYSGSKEITCIPPQSVCTFLCTEPCFASWISWTLLQDSLFCGCDVPLPKHSQEIEIIEVILSPAQNLMGKPIIQEKAAIRKIFAIFSSDKNFCSWQNFVLEREKESSNLLLLIKTFKGTMSAMRRKGPGFPFFSIFWKFKNSIF